MSSKAQEVKAFIPFKEFECILNNKLEPYPKKIESLIEIWRSLSQWKEKNSESDIEYVIQIINWAKLHTLNIVLTGKWKMFKADYQSRLLNEVEKTQKELMKISDGFSKKFQKLADVIRNPWDDPVLASLLHDSNATIGPKEIEFFCVETAYLVSVRLKKLCESQCEDLALNLVTAFMNCYHLSQTQNFSLNAPETHVLFCFDIHVALLYRYDRMSEIVALFKKLTLEEGLQLIRRFAKKRVKISKVWRNYPEITFLASQVFVTAAVTKPIQESGEVLKEILEAWIDFSIEHSLVEKLETSIRRIIQAATAAQHIYICCEIIPEKFGTKLKTFTIELYIRALTTDMNNLESQKTENDKEKVEETTKRLANGFSNLADILKDNVKVSRECELTAFSLEPTLNRLRKIEEFARLSGFNVLDTGQMWECKLHPPISSSDDLCWKCNACEGWMCKPNLDLRLTTNFTLNEALNCETLGISPQLCDDLAVVLNGPRYHLLSWLLQWKDLHRLCEMYLNDLERTKNIVTELKFLDIDYSMFATVKREPVDELAGIEKGYEKFLYSDMNDKLADIIENKNPEPPELPQQKSDPNTLKTLRMFRPNSKKNKTSQVSQAPIGSNNLGSSLHNLANPWLTNINYQDHLRNFFSQQLNAHSSQYKGVNFTQKFYSFENALFNQNILKQQRTPEGVIDYSSSSSAHSLENYPNNTKDFTQLNINKRKPSESVNSYHPSVVNGVHSSSNNLQNMISYEFSRITSEAKRAKTSQPRLEAFTKARILAKIDSSQKTDAKSLQNHSDKLSLQTSLSKTYGNPRLNLQKDLKTVSQTAQNLIKSETPLQSDITPSQVRENITLKSLLSNSKDLPPKYNLLRANNFSQGLIRMDYVKPQNTPPQKKIVTSLPKVHKVPLQDPGLSPSIKSSVISSQQTTPENLSKITQNHFLLNTDNVKQNLKRSDHLQIEEVPEKKIKLTEANGDIKVIRSKNGIVGPLNKDGTITTEDKTEGSVQNENSSKNANCCLPANGIKDDVVKDDCKVIHLNKTPITHTTHSKSCTVNPTQQQIKRDQELSLKTKLEADNKIETDEMDLRTDVNQIKTDTERKNCNETLLKSLSNEHIPIIIENSTNDMKMEVKISSKNEKFALRNKKSARCTGKKLTSGNGKVDCKTEELNCKDEKLNFKDGMLNHKPKEPICNEKLTSGSKELNGEDVAVINNKHFACNGEKVNSKNKKSVCRGQRLNCGDKKSTCRDRKLTRKSKKFSCKNEKSSTLVEKLICENKNSSNMDEKLTGKSEKPSCVDENLTSKNEKSLCQNEKSCVDEKLTGENEKSFCQNEELIGKNEKLVTKNEASFLDEKLSSKKKSTCLVENEKTNCKQEKVKQQNYKSEENSKSTCMDEKSNCIENGLLETKKVVSDNTDKPLLPKEEIFKLPLSNRNEINNELLKDVAKSNSCKEIKIILQRLSTKVIENFMSNSHNCICGCDTDNKRRPVGRPRKFCLCCKERENSSSSPSNHVFERIDYDKHSLRNRSNRLRQYVSGNDDGIKKTGRPVKKYSGSKQKKVDDFSSQQEDNSDTKIKKPKKDEENDKLKIANSMNPRVILERLPLNSNYVRSVLSNVPGLNDYEMIRPGNVDHIVNVVQVSGQRTTSNVQQNNQTSTQITPHIQRIGQPRSDKPEHNTNSESTTTTSTPNSTPTTTKPSTSQPSTLINILSQQIIRPGQSNCVRNRSSPLINILSQQIIRPATTQASKINSESSSNAASVKVATTTDHVVTNEVSTAKTVTTTTKTVTNTPSSGQGTILQFICKSTLPKFQQAFGKSVYQNNTETNDATSTCNENPTTTTDSAKKSPIKNSSVNIQPIQGGVIYTRQMPVGQTINLIPPGRGQVFRIASSNSDQISLVKDTVIHSKMSALLAAALQGKQKSSEVQSDGETTVEENSNTRVTVTRPTLVQNARIVKPVLQIPSNVIRTSPQSNLSSTTLEQLREFDMVYKQIKERSSTSTPSEANTSEPNETSQRISVTYLNQGQKYTQLSPVVVVSSYCNLQPAASPALSVTSQGSSSPCVTPAPTPTAPKVASKSSKGKTVKNTTTQASKASPIPKPQQKPQEDEHTTQRIFDILAEYAEQLRNSPDLNNKPAPRRRSNPPTNPSQNSKRKKSSNSKKSGQCSSIVSEADIEDHRTVGSEDSSCGVQISVQEEEQCHPQTNTTESNDSSSGSTRQQLILADNNSNQTRNLIIAADSSVGEALKMPNTAVLVPGNYIMPVSMVKGGQQIAVVSGGSKILATVPARSGPNMLLFQSFINQNRNKSGVPTVKYSTIQPISGISSQSLTGVSGQPPVILPPNSHNLTSVALGQPIALKKVDESERVNTELLLTISQSRDNGNSPTDSKTHPDGSTNTVSSTVSNIEKEESIVSSDSSSEKVFQTYQKSIAAAPIATPVIAQTATANKRETTLAEDTSTRNSTTNVTSENSKNEPTKTLERVQSVLVTACTSNGPMLSHTPPRYRKPSETTGISTETTTTTTAKEEFVHNGEKQNNNEQKQFQSNATYFQNKNKKVANPPRLDRELHQLCLQRKQAAIEREMRLQKSLSEECEDLGVGEPSASDLFPEADILFDANHSPSFDQTSQDHVKKQPPQESKEESKPAVGTLFSDDDNSGSVRTDFLFESVEYQAKTEIEYKKNQQLTNGQNNGSNESASSCEDHTLLPNCPSMSDVTLNSPVSPDPYHENAPSTVNKYKYKYSNRRKGEKNNKQTSETWTGEVSSSEDTTGSTELGKSSSHNSPESCTNKRSHSVSCDDELSDGSYKVVRVGISKSDVLKDEESCEGLHCEDDLDCSPSGRGARRSVKKMCSCCNGSQDGASRKRPTSRPHTPAPHKKAFLNKKR